MIQWFSYEKNSSSSSHIDIREIESHWIVGNSLIKGNMLQSILSLNTISNTAVAPNLTVPVPEQVKAT